MDLTKEEIDKLKQATQVFKLHTLSRQQVEYILDRKLTDKSWQAYVTSESRKLKSTKSPKEKSKPQFTFADVAKHAAIKGQRRNLRNQNNEYRIAKLFRENKNNYKIEKLREFNYSKFSTRSEYKIYGDVDLFQMQSSRGTNRENGCGPTGKCKTADYLREQPKRQS